MKRPGRPPRRRTAARGPGPREVALDVLRRVRRDDAYANLVLPRAITRAGLGARDAALATELTYGTLRRLGSLDWVISLHASRPLGEIDPDVLDALRLGAYQLLHTKIPDFAAVAETTHAVRPRAALGFVNAILRRIASARESIPWPERDGDLVSFLGIRYAHPEWLVRMWLEELGPDDTEGLLAAANEVPPVTIAARPGCRDALAARFDEAGIQTTPGRWSADVLEVRSGGRPDT